MEELKRRKTPRYQGFDYDSVGAYFITICTQDRRCLLSRIVGTGVPDCPKNELTGYGKIADKYINQLNEFYEHLSVEDYVIMPNHIHILLWIKKSKKSTELGQSRTPVPTSTLECPQINTAIDRANSACSQFVSTLKRFCNKEYGANIWQARFYDHIIRSREDYEEHLKYIYENPVRWRCDELYTNG